MKLVLALTKVMHLYQALFHQGLETEIDAAKADAQLLGQDSLAEIGALMQTTQDFELDFLLETSESLYGGYEAQVDTGSVKTRYRRAVSRSASAVRGEATRGSE